MSYSDTDMPLHDDPDDVRTFASHTDIALIEHLLAFFAAIYGLIEALIDLFRPIPPPSRELVN